MRLHDPLGVHPRSLFPRKRSTKSPREIQEHSEHFLEHNSGKEFENFGDFSFCTFSDLTLWGLRGSRSGRTDTKLGVNPEEEASLRPLKSRRTPVRREDIEAIAPPSMLTLDKHGFLHDNMQSYKWGKTYTMTQNYHGLQALKYAVIKIREIPEKSGKS